MNNIDLRTVGLCKMTGRRYDRPSRPPEMFGFTVCRDALMPHPDFIPPEVIRKMIDGEFIEEQVK